MKRILYLQHAADRYGSSRALLQLIDGLDRTRFEPLVALAETGPLWDDLRALGVEPILHPALAVMRGEVLRSWRVLPFLAGMLPAFVQTAWLARRVRADLLHSNSWVLLAGGPASRLLRKPHVWHIRELPPNLGGIKPWLTRMTVATSDRLLCVSQAVAAQFDGYARPGQVRVIYDGLERQPSPDPVEVQALRARYPSDTRLIGLVGRLHPQKGQAELLRALALLSPELRQRVRVLLIGDRTESYPQYPDELAKLCDELQLTSQVEFLGFRRDVPALLRTLDLLVLPATRAEGLGGALLEALDAGVPVVATALGGAVELLRDQAGGLLVQPGDVGALARTIERLLRDESLRQQLWGRGQQLMATQFQVSDTVSAVQQIYTELL